MSAPALASASAMPRPMPREAPVTSAVRPARLISAMSLSLLHQFGLDFGHIAARGVAPFGRRLAVEDMAARVEDRDRGRALDFPEAEARRDFRVPAAPDLRHADIDKDDMVAGGEGGGEVGAGDRIGETGAG